MYRQKIKYKVYNTNHITWYLDLHLEIDSDWWYDKRNDLNFAIVNFPFICSTIPATPAYYGVYISQLTRYSRACRSYQDSLDRGLKLTRKLLNQGFLLVKLKSSLRKCYGRHHELVDSYGISSRSSPSLWLITGFVTRSTRRVSLVEQELLTLPEYLSSPPVLEGCVLFDL